MSIRQTVSGVEYFNYGCVMVHCASLFDLVSHIFTVIYVA